MAIRAKTLGQLLREWRESKGFTNQAQAAVYLGVALRAYQNWERDQAYPETKTLVEKLAPELGLDLGFGDGATRVYRYRKTSTPVVAA